MLVLHTRRERERVERSILKSSKQRVGGRCSERMIGQAWERRARTGKWEWMTDGKGTGEKNQSIARKKGGTQTIWIYN